MCCAGGISVPSGSDVFVQLSFREEVNLGTTYIPYVILAFVIPCASSQA